MINQRPSTYFSWALVQISTLLKLYIIHQFEARKKQYELGESLKSTNQSVDGGSSS